MKSIELFCKKCQKRFDYPLKEYTRQSKKGRSNLDFFCSLSCSSSYINEHRPPEVQEKISRALSSRSKGNKYSLKGKFTYYLNKTRNRSKKGWNLSEDILQTQWDKQHGRCNITGISMDLYSPGISRTPIMASIDRINSNFGYYANNIQFVCYSINLAKNDFDNETIIEFVKNITRLDNYNIN